MQWLILPEPVPGMAAKGFPSAAESSGGVGFFKLMLVTVTLNKK